MLDRPPFSAEIFSRVVDPLYGIVRHVQETMAEPNLPGVFVFGARCTDTSGLFGVRCTDRGSGAGLTAAAARAAAVGEAIERYSCGYCDAGELVFGTWRELRHGHDLLSPEEFQPYDSSQLVARRRYPEFAADTPLAWTSAYSLAHRRWRKIPACLTYMPYRPSFSDRGEVVICPSSSNGLASGRSHDDALYAGLCECIERDGFMNLWLNRLPLPHIDIKDEPELADWFHEHFERDLLEYHLIDATTDVGVATLICVVVDHDLDPPILAVGGAARLDPVEAAQKAILEAAHTYFWGRALRNDPRRYRDDFSDVLDFEDHVRLYASGALYERARFLLAEPSRRRLSDLPRGDPGTWREAVELVTARIAAIGTDVLAIDLTTRDVADLGLCVTRAFVPGLQQLHAGFQFRRLGNPRLFELPRIMGYRSTRSSIDDLNPFPHPFP